MTDPPLIPDQQAPQQPMPVRPRMSALAIVAVVIAFIPFCPPVNALGAVLGVIAWRRIREAKGQLGGRRASLAAIFGGLFMSIVTLVGFQQLAEMMETQQQQDMGVALDGFMNAVDDGEYDSALQWWSIRDTTVSHEELVEFGSALHEKLGTFSSVRIGSMQTVPGASLLAPEANCWIICRFGSDERNGSARFVLKTATDRWTLMPLLIELRIDDGDGGEFVLPLDAPEPGAGGDP